MPLTSTFSELSVLSCQYAKPMATAAIVYGLYCVLALFFPGDPEAVKAKAREDLDDIKRKILAFRASSIVWLVAYPIVYLLCLPLLSFPAALLVCLGTAMVKLAC
jgi:hypothetical protein